MSENRPVKSRQIRPQWMEPELRELAEKMKAGGHYGLFVERPKLGPKSLEFLEDFDHLTRLTIYGVARGIRAVAKLSNLKHLGLLSVHVADYGFLAGLENLEHLSIKQGSCKAFDSLRQATRLKRLQLWGISSLEDAGFLADLKNLVELEVTDCPRLAAFPSLAGLTRLETLFMSGLLGLQELDGIVEAPNLRELTVGPVPSLPVEAFALLAKAPSLKRLRLGIDPVGSKRTDEARRHVPAHVEVV